MIVQIQIDKPSIGSAHVEKDGASYRSYRCLGMPSSRAPQRNAVPWRFTTTGRPPRERESHPRFTGLFIMSRRVQPELLFLARGGDGGYQLLWPRMRGLRPMTRFMFLLRLIGEPLPLQDLISQRVVLEHGHVAHVPGIVAVARRL
jgi:hypothetical protein